MRIKKIIAVLLALVFIFSSGAELNAVLATVSAPSDESVSGEEGVSEDNAGGETSSPAVIINETVPAKVTGLKRSNVTGSSFTLSWEKSDGSEFYGVYIFSKKKNKYRRIESTDKLSFSVTGLKPSRVYKFKVRGMRIADDLSVKYGKYSKPISVRTAPAKVNGLISTDIGINYISVQWNEVKEASAYRLYMYSRKEDKYVFLTSTRERSYTIRDLLKGMLYTIRVRAVYDDGKKNLFGEYSDELLEYTQTDGSIHTNAQAAKYYNSLINSVKGRKSIVATRKKTVSATAKQTSKYSLLMTVQNLLNMFKGTKKETKTFRNGFSGSTSVSSFVQPYGRSATLRGKDILSFSLKPDGGSKKLSLTLIENSSTIDGKAKKIGFASSTGRAVKGVNITKKNIVPVSIISGTQTYPGTKISLKINPAGQVTALDINNKVNVDADCTVSSLRFNAKGSYRVVENYIFQ